ncbi:hypothetical protein BDZ85DRAFT_95197 [Elsinoe ampelina]|uniref:Uncharacterized protein n=1 Tax=Elsinoe ampelina TaxID=302913 RepID=A0A6A6GDY7_9PEZI|nr:hypothetical protein BDZ85DRAFT_95197 [Elsinoe ampelina]
MAVPRPGHHRKRQRSSSLDLLATPDIRKRERRTSPLGSHCRHALDTTFWNSLTQVPLTRSSLREFNRRRPQSLAHAPSTPVQGPLQFSVAIALRDITVRRGICLTSLRGYARTLRPKQDMTDSTSRVRRRGQPVAARTPAIENVVNESKSKATSTYDAAFKQMMIDAGVYPADYQHGEGRPAPIPGNFEEMQNALTVPLPCSSPHTITVEGFKEYLKGLPGHSAEVLVMADVVIKMMGPQDPQENQSADKLFNNIKPIRNHVTRPKPDFYAGAFTESIHESVRKDLNKLIIPCSNDSLPAAPNFFFEGKYGPGRPDVALLQALHDGAIGARAMFELQNYKNIPAERRCDNNAYTIMFTYAANTLTMFSMHPFINHRGLMSYQMTQLDAFIMYNKLEQFQAGVAALYNARQFCLRHRDRFIRDANHMAMPNTNTSFGSDSTDELALDYEKRRREVLALRDASASSSSQPGARRS